MVYFFPYFLQFKSEFCNKKFMIWATVSSWSCFCWLYRASLSLAAKNIINLILVLIIWWCACRVMCCWKRVYAMTSAFSLQNSVSLCPASFYTPRRNLPVTWSISWLPTFAFQSPMMKNDILLLLLVLEGLVGHQRTVQLQLLWHYCLGHRLGLLWY